MVSGAYRKSYATQVLERKQRQEAALRAAQNLLSAKLSAVRAGLIKPKPDPKTVPRSKTVYDQPAQRLYKYYEDFPVMFDCSLPIQVAAFARLLPESEAVPYLCGYFRWREYVLNHDESRDVKHRSVLIGSHIDWNGRTAKTVKKDLGRTASVVPDPRKIEPEPEPEDQLDQPVWWEQIQGEL